jgi:hypothetical protein
MTTSAAKVQSIHLDCPITLVNMWLLKRLSSDTNGRLHTETEVRAVASDCRVCTTQSARPICKSAADARDSVVSPVLPKEIEACLVLQYLRVRVHRVGPSSSSGRSLSRLAMTRIVLAAASMTTRTAQPGRFTSRIFSGATPGVKERTGCTKNDHTAGAISVEKASGPWSGESHFPPAPPPSPSSRAHIACKLRTFPWVTWSSPDGVE